MGAKAVKKSAKCVRFRLFSGLAKTKSNAIDQRLFATNVSSDDGRLVWGRVFGRESCEKIGEPRLAYFRNYLESEVRRYRSAIFSN